jgi:hypothetical protein
VDADAKPAARGRHPLLRRLPLLVLLGGGLWLWRATEPPEHSLVWRLDGTGWSAVRGLEFQLTGPDGQILKREEHFFPAAPPSEVTLKVDLPEGTYRTLIFVKEPGQPTRPPLVEGLTIGEEPYILKTLRLPASR